MYILKYRYNVILVKCMNLIKIVFRNIKMYFEFLLIIHLTFKHLI